MRKLTVLSILLAIALFSVPSSAKTVPLEEYDRVSSELSTIQSQLVSLQGKLAEVEILKAQKEELSKQYDAVKSEFETLQAKYTELSSKYDEVNKQYDTVKSEFETIQTKYEELSTEYEELDKQFEELSEQYNIIIEGTAEINEADVEQEIFKLVNQERINNGLNELIWGKNLYKWAMGNSHDMAEDNRVQYSDYPSWQEVFWAAGYSTTDKIVKAALIIWKNSLQYERNILNTGATYGAVAVYKSGDIFYITYIASTFK